MFDDWKQAWRQAVENFRRELSELEDGDASPAVRSMRRDLVSARGALRKLDEEIERTRKDTAEEREQEAICQRREGQARGIGDEETARIAAEYGARHAHRAQVLERKATVLSEERELLASDLASMEAVMEEHGGAAETIEDRRPEVLEERAREDRQFAELDREARERAAEQRLEELKRKMR